MSLADKHLVYESNEHYFTCLRNDFQLSNLRHYWNIPLHAKYDAARLSHSHIQNTLDSDHNSNYLRFIKIEDNSSSNILIKHNEVYSLLDYCYSNSIHCIC